MELLSIAYIYIHNLIINVGNFTCLAVVFNLRRRLGYHLFHTYIPSGLIVVMSWISFWIKPEAIPARATLGVTSLLTLGINNFVRTFYFKSIFRSQKNLMGNTSFSFKKQRKVPSPKDLFHQFRM